MQFLTLTLFTTLFFTSMNAYSGTKEQTSNKGLIETHSDISKKYKTVSHLKANDVAKMDENSYVIFDVREEEEHNVSHIKDAIWVDPSINASSFYEKFSQKIKGKTVILYCSVGVRSTRLAEKLLDSEENKLKIYKHSLYTHITENGVAW